MSNRLHSEACRLYDTVGDRNLNEREGAAYAALTKLKEAMEGAGSCSITDYALADVHLGIASRVVCSSASDHVNIVWSKFSFVWRDQRRAFVKRSGDVNARKSHDWAC